MSKQCISCFNEYQEGIRECPYCGYVEGTRAQEGCHLPIRSVLHQRYRIGKSLGNGNFGVTYIAWDTMLETRVAIKEYLPRELSTRVPGNYNVQINPGCESTFAAGKSSFIRESRVLAELRDAETEYDEVERAKNSGALGIVKIFNYFEENNTAYIVMEYLEGMNLSEYIEKNGRLPYNEVLRITMSMLQTLAVVHEHGIIHRDIAPDNVFICDDGRVVLIDFGAARYMTTRSSSSLATIVKMGYAPQEQYKSNGNRGTWTDIYAVAATMYYMLTKTVPQPSFDRLETDNLLPPSKVLGKDAKKMGVTSNVDNAIMNAMNILPENRTKTAGEFLTVLSDTVEGKKIERNEEDIERESAIKSVPKWMRYGIGGLSASLVAVVVLILFLGRILDPAKFIVPDGMARVPNVTEKYNVTDAEKKLSDDNLLLVVDGHIYDDYIEDGMVLRQNPHAGSVVYNGTAINVSVSLPENTSLVPNVLNFTRDLAINQMESSGFIVNYEEAFSDTVAPGCVISQSVDGGKSASTKRAITIVISKGPEKKSENVAVKEIEIPDMIGKQLDSAVKDAKQFGLYVAVASAEYSESIPYGQIIDQTPTAGTIGRRNDVIFVSISLGIKKVSVPNLQYLSEEEARTLLIERNLSVDVVYEESKNVKSGVVIRQNIKQNTQVDIGTTIKIYVSTGHKVEVPDVVGLTQEKAQSKLLSAKLAYAVTKASSKTVPEGTVMEQSEKAGSKVEQGTIVTIVVSSGSDVIEVTGISLNKSSLTLVYGQTDTLIASVKPSDATNTSVKWTSSDSSVVSVSSVGVLSAKKVGQATITVTDSSGKHSASCSVTVKKVLESIAVTSNPSKTSYSVGESFNKSGLVITAYFNDGSNTAVTDKCSISKLDSSTGGSKQIKASYTYEGTTKECYINVTVRTLSSISVTTKPSKLSYSVNEAFSTSGMVVTATYTDNSTRTVTDSCTVDSGAYNKSKKGTYSIKVTYSEGNISKTDSFNVSVSAKLTIQLVSGSNPLDCGGTGSLRVNSDDASLLSGTITWLSSNSGAVQVTGNGTSATIQGKGAGKATITVRIGEDSATYDASSYGAWSEWQTGNYAGINVEVQNKNGYLTSTKSTTTSTTSNTMNGWTLYQTDNNSYWTDYGNWSAWQDDYVAKSDSRDVRTQTVSVPHYASTDVYKTVYHYYRYSTARTGGTGSDIKGTPHGSNYYSYDFDYELTEYGTQGNYSRGYRYYYNGKNYSTVWKCNPFTTSEYVRTDYYIDYYYDKTQYSYRDRSYIESYTYYFYQWSEYGNWTEGAKPQDTDSRKYKTENRYRWRKCP